MRLAFCLVVLVAQSASALAPPGVLQQRVVLSRPCPATVKTWKRPPKREVFGSLAAAAVCLDRPVINLQSPVLDALGNTLPIAGGVAAFAALSFVVARAVASLSSSRGSSSDSEEEEEVWTAKLKHFWRLRTGSLKAFLETCRYLWNEATGGDSGAIVLADAWIPCILESREMDDDYTAYRLALRPGRGHVLPLEVGQSIAVMCMDERNRVVRTDMWLASSRHNGGGFVDVVAPSKVRRDRWLANSPETSTAKGFDPETAYFLDCLDQINIGGEAAVKAGRKGFQYRGQNLPITNLQCFVEDLGALPVMHLLKESLPRGRSTVKKADVFWLNEHEDDFITLYDDLEDLYYTYNNKMTLTCVVDDALHKPLDLLQNTWSPDESIKDVRNQGSIGLFDRNPDLLQATPQWQPGTLAVIAGNPAFAEDISTYLAQKLDYPRECIMIF